MLSQSSEGASKLLCHLISAVLESCEFGLRKESGKEFLVLKRSLSVQLVVGSLLQSRKGI